MPSIEQPNDSAIKEPTSQDLAKKQLETVFGDSGTKRFSGYFIEEYNPEWRDDKRVENVEKMRRGDATIQGAMRAIKSPILSAEWNVVSDEDDEKSEEIREFVEHALFNMEGRTWKEFLREALNYLAFGHYVFEKLWKIEKGEILLRDLAPRIPSSIIKWKMKDGVTPGITQRVLNNDEGSVNGMAEIPMSKLLILTNEKEGDDLSGQSIFRSAYKHWIFLELLYKIQGISAERFGVGIPVVYPGEGSGDEEQGKAEDMASNIRSNEKGYIVMPGPKKEGGWTLEILTPGAGASAANSAMDGAIKHHSSMILMSVMATFLQLGTNATGSYALSEDQSSFFLKCEQDMASYLAEQINAQVIKEMVDLNFGPQKCYPYLKATSLGDIDFGEYATTLSSLVNAGLVKMNAKMIQFVHREFKLPEISEEDMEMMQEQEIADALTGLEGGQGDGMDVPQDDPQEDPTEDPEEEDGNTPPEKGKKPTEPTK